MGCHLCLPQHIPVRGCAVVYHIEYKKQAGSRQGPCYGQYPFSLKMQFIGHGKIPGRCMRAFHSILVIYHGQSPKVHQGSQYPSNEQHYHFQFSTYSCQHSHGRIAVHKQGDNHGRYHHNDHIHENQPRCQPKIHNQQQDYCPEAASL